MSQEVFTETMHKKRIYPAEIVSLPCEVDGTVGYLMRFERMKDVKETMVKLHDMKVRKQVADDRLICMHPVHPDIQWQGDKVHEDGRLDDDGDLDEPIEY